MSKLKVAAYTAVAGVCALSVLLTVTDAKATAAETSSTAMLVGAMGEYSQWSSSVDATYPVLSGSQVATVTGDGQYTVSFSVASGTASASSIDYLCLQIEGMTSDNYPDLALQVDSVSVDGTAVDYTTTASNINLAYYASGVGYSRVYLTVTDGWGTDVTEDLPSATTVTDNVSVTFTVSGTSSGPVETNASADDDDSDSSSTSTTTSPSSSDGSATTTTTTTESSVDNSTTGDNGIAGLVAVGVLAASVAVASCIKRK